MAPKAVLIGLPGSGKSTIGRRLAKSLGTSMLDTDAAIEETTGRTIADIFATDGEKEFRRIEEDVIRAALQSHDGVLSLGGGAVDRLENPQATRRRRRRPSWRRGPSSLTPKPSTEAPPTPAAVAARHPGGSPGRRTGGARND